jgi:hypothetical protein
VDAATGVRLAAAELFDDGGDGEDPVELVAVAFQGGVGGVVAGKFDEVFVELHVHDFAEDAFVLEVGDDRFAIGSGDAGEENGDITVGETGFHGVAPETDAEGAFVGDVAGHDLVPIERDFAEVGGLAGLSPGEDGQIAQAIGPGDIAVGLHGGGFFEESEAGAQGIAGRTAALDLGKIAAVDVELLGRFRLGEILADTPETDALGEVVADERRS